MRKSARASIAVVFAVGILIAGCSANPDPEPSQGAAQESTRLPPAEGTTSYPLTLESPYGETVLEKRPERIAAIVPNAIDTELLLSLEVTPVLSSIMVREGGYLDEAKVAELETYEYARGDRIPVEAIAASNPDLIVAVGWLPGYGELRDYYEQLSQIAPVVTDPEASQQIVPWQNSIRILGEALDLRDAAEAVVTEHDERFAQIRTENPGFGGLTASWTIYYGAAFGLQYFSQPDSAPSSFLTDLGFSPNPRAVDFEAEPTVSDELLSRIDADVLILGQSIAASETEMQELTGRDLFRALGAVSSDHFVQLPPKTDDGGDLLWAITSGGPIGNAWAAEHIVPLLADVL